MGAGFDRMNDVTVMQTSQGICAYLLQRYGKPALEERGVVIGYDGRHCSYRFSGVAAAAFLAKGAKVYIFSQVGSV